MANIIDNLNTLETNIDNAKFKMAKNLKDKGVQALPSDKLDILVDKIVDIPSGSCNLQELNVTENGVYTPQAGDVKGYNKVTVNVPSSGSCTAGVCFDEIGYAPNDLEPFQKGIEYAKQIYDTWDPSLTSLLNKFEGDKNLKFIPLVDTSNVTNMLGMFEGCNMLFLVPKLNTSNVTNMLGMFLRCGCLQTIPQLDTSSVTNMSYMLLGCNFTTSPKLNTSKVTNMNYMFEGCNNMTTVLPMDTSQVTTMSGMFSECGNLTTIPQLDTSQVTSMHNMFNQCFKLFSLPALNTSNVTDMYSLLPSNIKKVEGLDFTSCTNINLTFGASWGPSPFRYANLTNLGAQESITSILIPSNAWGADGDGITGCRKSLTDSLIVNSFDRAAAGFGPCTITLSAQTKGLLTEDEISQIIAKGFTLA